jgi:hypothetical protein
MEGAIEVFWIVVYLLNMPVGMLLFGLIALLILSSAYLVKRASG